MDEDGLSSRSDNSDSSNDEDCNTSNGDSDYDAVESRNSDENLSADDISSCEDKESGFHPPGFVVKYLKMVNIASEFSSGTFLVDGDSLILSALCDRNLSKSHGGQMLHLVYLVERQLQILLRHRGKFEVVFFKDSIFSWTPENQLSREVLMYHLKEVLCIAVLDQFENVWNPTFEAFKEKFIPTFFLMFDCFQEDLPSQYKMHLTLQLEKVLALCVNVTFINDMTVGASTLNAYHILAKDVQCFVKRRKDMVKKTYLDFYKKKSSVNLDSTLQLDLFSEFEDIQSECLAAYLFIKQHLSNEQYVDFAKLFILYVLVKRKLPIQKRVLPKVQENSNLKLLIEKFLCTLTGVIQQQRESLLLKKNENVCDIWDGNLFATVCLEYFEKFHEKKEQNVVFESDVVLMFKKIIDKFAIECSVKLQSSLPCEKNLMSLSLYLENTKPNLDNFSLKILIIPVHSRLVECYAGNIYDKMEKLKETDQNIKDLVQNFKTFEDKYHWHCKRLILDEYEIMLENRKKQSAKVSATGENEDKMKIMKWEQKKKSYLSKYLHVYGESLGVTEPTIIVLEEKNKTKHKQNKAKQQHKVSQKMKTIGKKQLIIEQNLKNKLEEKQSKDEKHWQEIKLQVRDMVPSKALQLIEENENSFYTDQFKVKVEVKKLSLLRKMLQDKKRSASLMNNETIKLFLIVSKLYNEYNAILSVHDKEQISKALCVAQFFNLLKLLNLEPHGKNTLTNSVCHIEFQLKNIGHLLARTQRSDRDPRISDFIPDTWQRQLFDAVDNNKSALIVAPTSSGKTYASYYCIEKVLRGSNDNVVVYVSPTKALVNQVQAFVFNKYKKNDLPAGKTICGVFTRDQRSDVENCQILITVPECLEILLLSAQSYAWSQKIKYVIFDEVHCIGGEKGSETWEHLLCLISCPFLALSATVANPRVLHSWLQEVQSFQKEHRTMLGSNRDDASYEVEMVIVKDRYSDLQNYAFDPEVNSLQKLHPVCALKLSAVSKHGLPEHLTLSPRECLELYEAMKNTAIDKPELVKLSPSHFFNNFTFLKRDDVREYEDKLKKEFSSWCANRNHFEAVQERLKKVSQTDVSACSSTEMIGKSVLHLTQKSYQVETFISLIKTLERNCMFPVIVFCLDRNLCSLLVETVVSYCEEKEREYFSKKKRDKKPTSYEKSVQKKCMLKASEKDTEKKREISNFWFDHTFVEGASFAGKGVLTKEDLTYLHDRVARQASELFMKGIRYGIAYHHAGLNNKYRSTVEILFRKKFLNIVVATTTLALGIHVPCKTVVIAGDSVYLDPLIFRQMSGRAGRRGFDMIGNAVFNGVSDTKISHLVAGDLPELLGNFPINVSLCLQLFILVNGQAEKASENTLIRVLSLLNHPLLLKEHPELDCQFKYFFLFSMQFLIREGFLKANGAPQGLAGLASHLYYHEPYNFAFIAVLNSGLFHELCKKKKERRNKIYPREFLENLIGILSYFFTNTEVHPLLEKKKRSTSVLILKKLPDIFINEILRYNQRVESVYNMYLLSISKYVNETSGEDDMLPLSGIKFKSTDGSEVPEENSIESLIRKSSLKNICCSNFVGTSSHSDESVYDPYDRISKVRHQIYTDVHEIPLVKVDFENFKLNSYALDFFKHGNIKAIREENGLKSGEEFQKLKDFCLTLQTIACSMDLFAPENDCVRQAFRQVADEYSEKFRSKFNDI